MIQHNSQDSDSSYLDSLLTILCNENPTFTAVLELFSKNCLNDHYLLLIYPRVVQSYFVLCSDITNLSITDSSLFDGLASINSVKFDNPTTFNGIEDVREVLAAPISNDLLLVLINPQTPSGISSEIMNATKSALVSIYEQVEVDIPYSIRCVNSFSDEKMAKLAQRSFSVNNYHPSEIFLNTFSLFVRSEISTRIGLDSADLLRFLVTLRSHYNDVPYHNWFHALDVTQFVFSVIMTANVRNCLPDLEVFGLLFSAICHDTDHNGMNNTFHRNAKTTLAHLAPNLPPLEHHHSCISMDLARKLLSPLNEEDRLQLSHFVINCIMATDMEQHKVFLTEFNEIQNGFDKSRPDHRQLLAQIILKAADLSNTIRDFEEATRMATKLSNECFRQGDKETELGLPVSPMCNRNGAQPLCCGQIGFYKFVAGPLMNELHTFFPALNENAKQFEQNLAQWEKLKTELEQEQNV